jgi:uncharacterized repeat protein (TIGR03943 family)
VTPANRGLLAVAVGVTTLLLASGDDYLHFLRPSMRPYLLAAGITFALLGVVVVAGAVLATRRAPLAAGIRHSDIDAHDHAHGERIAWLLLLPVAVAVLTPSALDAYGTARAMPYQQRQWALQDFDVQKYLRTQTIAGGVPVLPISDYIGAAVDAKNRKLLARHDIRVQGFVAGDQARGSGTFLLTRYRISCCAADATPMQLVVHVPPGTKVPPRSRWVEATVRLERVQPRHQDLTHVEATELRRIGTPSHPYDYN